MLSTSFTVYRNVSEQDLWISIVLDVNALSNKIESAKVILTTSENLEEANYVAPSSVDFQIRYPPNDYEILGRIERNTSYEAITDSAIIGAIYTGNPSDYTVGAPLLYLEGDTKIRNSSTPPSEDEYYVTVLHSNPAQVALVLSPQTGNRTPVTLDAPLDVSIIADFTSGFYTIPAGTQIYATDLYGVPVGIESYSYNGGYNVVGTYSFEG